VCNIYFIIWEEETLQNKNTLVVLDLETTWLNETIHSIIEIALIKIDAENFSEIWRFHSFVNPLESIPSVISW